MLLSSLKGIVVATVLVSTAISAVAETIDATALALEDFLVRATSQQDSVSVAAQNGRAMAPFFKFPRSNITYLTIAAPNVDKKIVTADLNRFLTTAGIVGLSVSWCEVKLGVHPGKLPTCATNHTADVIAAYPDTDPHSEIGDVVSRLQFKDEATAERIAEKVESAVKRVEESPCLGSVVQTEGEIDSAFILFNSRADNSHIRCSIFFSFAALGVRGSDLASVMSGESDSILTDRAFGQNSATALRFLYSEGLRNGMTNEDYVSEAKRWVEQLE